jgi:putative endonuclease
MKGHFVYILKCRNGELYTGYTVDPETRLRLHNSGVASKYTRGRLPINLVRLEKYPSRSAALKREAKIKKLSRLEKLRFCSSGPSFC